MHKKRKRRRKHQRQKNLNILLCALGLFLVLLIPYCIVCSRLDDGNIWGNVSVNGVPVGGLSKKEASLAVHSQFGREYHDAALKVDLAGKEYSVDIFPALGFSAFEAVNKANKPGHGLWLMRGIDRLVTNLRGSRSYTVYPYVKDEAAIDEAIKASGILEFNSTVEPKWEIKASSLIIHKGKEGAAINVEQLKQNILTALKEHSYSQTITCPAEMTPPKEADIQEIYKSVNGKVKNATLDPKKDYAIVPSVRGIDFNVASAQSIYDKTAYGEDAVIPISVVEPEITTEDMEKNLFRDTLASYSTYAGGTSARISNIYKAVEACDGTILLPGETFSYNNALGERTEERGYQSAGAYSSDSVIQEVGGGICQVSSTIFAALLYTELDITERRNHSMAVSYLPKGMDAAVSWGDMDFRFTNNYKYPVKMNVYFDGYTITVSFAGTKENDNIIDVSLNSSDEYSAETYRIIYDSNWNQLSSQHVASSYYTMSEAEKKAQEEAERAAAEENQPPEATPAPDSGENTDNSGNTDGSGNPDGSDGSDWAGDSGSSDGSDWSEGSGSSDGSDWSEDSGEPPAADGSDGSIEYIEG